MMDRMPVYLKSMKNRWNDWMILRGRYEVDDPEGIWVDGVVREFEVDGWMVVFS